MFKNVVSGLGIWTLIIACGWVLGEASVPASQDLRSPMHPSASEMRPMKPQSGFDPSVDRQMLAFERHARVNMLLYAGPLQGPATMNPVAITLKAASQ